MKVIRCSKLARVMMCAGYVYLPEEEDTTSEPAREGTAAGEYLQYLIEGKPIGTVASNGFYYTDDIKFYTLPIAQDIVNRAKDQVLCETRIDWQTRSGIWIKGQYDAAFVDHRDYLCIEDLKFGWGIVDVVRNWQVIGYAIGEVIRRGRAFSHISLKIHQPRPHHEDGTSREWLITYEELLALKEEIEIRMDEIAAGRKEFQTGPSCKYCQGAGELCTAFNRLTYRSIEISTSFFQDSLNEQEIAAQLDQVTRAAEVLKIKADALVSLGNERIKHGKIIPGYVQDNQYSHREWKQGVSAESIKVMTNLDVMKKSMMSPKEAEVMGVHKDLVKKMSGTRLTGVKLKKKDSTKLGNDIFGKTAPVGGV